MDFLYFLERIRVPGLNELMLAITQLGDETAFLVIALILFWCVDKLQGYYIMSIGFFGTLINQFLKLLCRIPRPWVLDENFTILEQAREGASGYSFPSGHTQNAVGTFGGIALTVRQRWIQVVCVILMVLIPFSRMYLGVHTPKDVLVAAAIALVLIFALKPVVLGKDGKYIPVMLGVMTACAVAFLCYVEWYPFPADMDAENLTAGIKNAYTLLGALLGLLVVYYVDGKWMHFQVKAVWWAQILKLALGLALVLAVKSGLKAPLNALFGGHMAATGIRYFFVVLAAGILWPMTFRWFAKLGRNDGKK